MGLQIDWYNQIIQVTSPTTSVSMQVLHDFIEDQMATPRGMTESDILQPEGKIEDPVNPGIFSQIIIVLNSPWQIQFWGGSGYTRIYGGKLVGGLNDQPIKATGTAGDVTVLESPVDGITAQIETGVSGLTAAESTQLNNINARTAYADKIIKNKKALEKRAGTWWLIIYDDNGTTEILKKELTDHQDGLCDDLVAGTLAKELHNSV